MPRVALSDIAVRRGRRREISPVKLRSRLREGGALDQLPSQLAGTRVRAALFYGQAALAGYLTSTVIRASRRRAFVELLRLFAERTAGLLRPLPDAMGSRYPEHVAVGIARSLGAAIHVGVTERLRTRERASGVRGLSNIARDLEDAEREFGRLLIHAQEETVAGSLPRLSVVLDQLVSLAADLESVAERLGPMTKARSRRVGEASVRLGILTHRLATTGAALVLIDWRLRFDGATRADTMRAAQSRRVLSRSRPVPASWRTAIRQPHVGQRTTIMGRVRTLSFEHRGKKPFSLAQLGTALTMMIPFKNVRRLGWRVGTAVRASVKVTRLRGQLVAETGFTGPGNLQRTVWEEWLGVLARPAYVRTPESVDIEWSLVPAGRAPSPIELTSRFA